MFAGARPADTEAAPTPPSARPPSSKVSPIPPSETASPQVAAMAAKALAQLDRIPVKGRHQRLAITARSSAGPGPTTSRSTRATTAARRATTYRQRDLTDVVMQGKCRVSERLVRRPVHGERLRFERGVDVYRIQIDHVVALGDAWRTGAQQWTPRSASTANDLRNLQATVGGPTNRRRRRTQRRGCRRTARTAAPTWHVRSRSGAPTGCGSCRQNAMRCGAFSRSARPDAVVVAGGAPARRVA